MTQTKEDRLAAVHERAMRRFNDAWSAVYDVRQQCAADRRFTSVTGAQWEGALGQQFANKPMFEMNKVHLAVIRIINEYRNNRVDVDFTSKDGSADDKLADTCDSLYRADEYDSGAQEALDNAFEEAVTGGFGAYRMRACYEDDEDEDDDRQRIRIEPIFDADVTVFFDQNAKRQDKKDADFGFLLTQFTPDAFKDTYPGEDPESWPEFTSDGAFFDWNTPDVITVAEYYEIEHKKQKIHFFRGLIADAPELRVADDELTDEYAAELAATGFIESRQKTIKVRKVHKYLLNCCRVMEDEGIIAGKYIPIIPVYGKRWFVNKVERCMGHTRLAMDAQRLKNMLVSLLAEISTKSSVEKPIFTPEQMAGHTEMWSNDNIENYPYLLVNAITDQNGTPMPAGPIAYTKAPSIPQALAALLQITEQDLQDLLGNAQAGEEIQPNISGKVVELIQNRLDMQTFIYMSNFSKGVQYGGEVWLSMARDVYVEEGRKMKGMEPDGKTTSTIELMQPAIDKESGDLVAMNDLTKASFDVRVDVGPSSTSRRSSTVRQLTAILQVTQDPETRAVLEAMILMNMEGEGVSDARDYFRQKLVKQGVIKPTEEEQQEMEKAKEEAANIPDPNAIFLEASAQKAIAEAARAQAQVGTEHAKTIGTLAGVESTRLNDAIALGAALTPQAGAAPQQQPAPAQ